MIGRLLWFLASILVGALIIRLVLVFFGADPSSDFVNIIYEYTRPFVEPFFGIFGDTYGATKAYQMEIATLAAIIVYTVAANLLSRLFAPIRN